MLDLSGVELMLTAVCTLLCHRFVTKLVLIIWQCFDYLWEVLVPYKDFLFFQLGSTMDRLGVGKKLAWDTTKTADPNRPKGCTVPECDAQQEEVRKYLLLRENMGTGLLMWGHEWPLSHTFPPLFPSLIELCLSFFSFAFSILFPIPLRISSEQVAMWCFTA